MAVAQVQLKSDFTKHELVTYDKPLKPLGPDSVRIRTTVLSLSINNSAYAISGTFLSWWDTFPVPEDFPAPYNDRDTYGILSGWGFATVEESNVEGIAKGALLRGYVPMSTVPVDLHLAPAAKSGHYIEKSPHRAKVMGLYQRYTISHFKKETDADAMARDALEGVLWECSYLLNRFSFASDPPVINPAGDDLPWTESDADLSKSTVIALAASGKTALGLAHELAHGRAPGSGPRAVAGITSAANVEFVRNTGLYPAGVLSYEEALADGAAAVAKLTQGSERIVMLDFGARGTFTPDFHAALKAKTAGLPFTTIRVGFENKPYTQEGLMKDVFERGAALEMVQMNTSPLREQVLVTIGEDKYFDELEAAKKSFFDKGGVPGLQIKWSEGMKGLDAVWKRLCDGQVPPNEGVVVSL